MRWTLWKQAEPPEPTPEPDPCPHDDWKIYGQESIGMATCLKCRKSVRLSILINNWKARIEREFG